MAVGVSQDFRGNHTDTKIATSEKQSLRRRGGTTSKKQITVKADKSQLSEKQPSYTTSRQAHAKTKHHSRRERNKIMQERMSVKAKDD